MKQSDQKNNHSDRDHAVLSPSSAYRWSECPASVTFKDTRPPDQAAKDGTLFHEYMEEILSNPYENEDILRSAPYDMQGHISSTVEYVDNIIDTLDPAICYVEQRVTYNDYLFGTSDVLLIGKVPETSERQLHVIDFKYGHRRKDAPGNLQLALYGIMGVELLKQQQEFTPDVVITHIVQPRIAHVSEHRYTLKELERVCYPLLAMADSWSKSSPDLLDQYSPGGHCLWCPGIARCKAHKEYQKNSSLALLDDSPLETVKDVKEKVATLSNEELLKIFKNIPLIEDMISEVKRVLIEEATKGNSLPGYKLVHGVSRRKWSKDEEAVIAKLKELGVEEPTRQTLKTITDIEKEIGKDLLGSVTVKPDPKLILVHDSDKREGVSSYQDLLDELDVLN